MSQFPFRYDIDTILTKYRDIDTIRIFMSTLCALEFSNPLKQCNKLFYMLMRMLSSTTAHG